MAQYIDKDALVAEIKSQLHPVEIPHGTNYDDWDRGANSEKLNILSFIDTLEVKEVDLEKELSEVWKDWANEYDISFVSYKKIAKHFFELGLKTQKGK